MIVPVEESILTPPLVFVIEYVNGPVPLVIVTAELNDPLLP